MTIRDVVAAFVLADPTVASLIGTRLRPDWLPEKITYPAVVIKKIDIVRPAHLRGVASLATMRVQFDVYAAPASGISSRGTADAVGNAIRHRLDGLNPTIDTLTDASTSPPTDIWAWIEIAPESDGVEPEIQGGLSTLVVDYLVKYQTHGGLY
jgi:hypothetical protein